MFSILNKRQQINLIFILRNPLYRQHRIWSPFIPCVEALEGALGPPLTYRSLLSVAADDESDSDAEEEQTTVRAVSSHERAKQLHWDLLIGRWHPP